MEGEAVIRAKSLVLLSGYSLVNVASEMYEARQLRQADENKVIEELAEAASQAEHGELEEGTEQAIGHLAGFLARSVFRIHKCEPCHSLLVNRGLPSELAEAHLEEQENQDDVKGSRPDDGRQKSFSDFLNRGKLICPSRMAVQLSQRMCHIYKGLVREKNTRYALFGCGKPKEAFRKVMVGLLDKDGQLAVLECAEGHSFLPQSAENNVWLLIQRIYIQL